MAAGVTDHAWTMEEQLRYSVPPRTRTGDTRFLAADEHEGDGRHEVFSCGRTRGHGYFTRVWKGY
jgi:hypothetical protein